jgi:hypothetical protein
VSIRERIKAADAKSVPVVVEGWDGVTLYVHRLSLADKLAAADLADSAGEAKRIAWCVARAVRDESGARVFGDDDVDELVGMDGGAVAALWRVVRDRSRLFQTTEEAADAKNG